MFTTKKLLAMVLALVLAASFTACAGGNSGAPASDTSTSAVQPTSTSTGEKPQVAVVAGSMQGPYWQLVKKGAAQAAAELNVSLTFEGPPSESDIAIQIDMLKGALGRNPDAICLAALDAEGMAEPLEVCRSRGIPVIGFENGVPDAPTGTLHATAATDAYATGSLAAEKLYANPAFKAALGTATTREPLYVGVVAQTAEDGPAALRTAGFVERLARLAGEEDTQVTGHEAYNKRADNGATLVVAVDVPRTADVSGLQSSAQTLLEGRNPLAAIYAADEAAAMGILGASDDGAEFGAPNGAYAGIIAIGFGAGTAQRTAVENGWFYGSLAQDPFQIGYKAVELAVGAIKGNAAPARTVEVAAVWYDAENLSDPAISQLVYE